MNRTTRTILITILMLLLLAIVVPAQNSNDSKDEDSPSNSLPNDDPEDSSDRPPTTKNGEKERISGDGSDDSDDSDSGDSNSGDSSDEDGGTDAAEEAFDEATEEAIAALEEAAQLVDEANEYIKTVTQHAPGSLAGDAAMDRLMESCDRYASLLTDTAEHTQNLQDEESAAIAATSARSTARAVATRRDRARIESPTAGDPVRLADGAYLFRVPLPVLRYFDVEVPLAIDYSSAREAVGIFGTGWHSPFDSRIIAGIEEPPDLDALVSRYTATALDLTRRSDAIWTGAVRGAPPETNATETLDSARQRLDSAITSIQVARTHLAAAVPYASSVTGGQATLDAKDTELETLRATIETHLALCDTLSSLLQSRAEASSRIRGLEERLAAIDGAYRAWVARTGAIETRNVAAAYAAQPAAWGSAGFDSATVIDMSGTPILFTRTSENATTFESDDPGDGRLIDLGVDTGWRRECADGSVHLYSREGFLTAVRDRNGNEIRFRGVFGTRPNLNISDSAGRSRGRLGIRGGEIIIRIETLEEDHRIRVVEGFLRSVEGPEGSLEFEYREGRLVRVVNDQGERARIDYDPATGRVRAIHDASGGVERIEYPAGDRRIYRDPDGYETEYRLRGSRVVEERFAEATRFYHYDTQGRLAETINPDGSRTLRGYDETGNLIRLEEPGGFWRRYDRDHRGDIVTVTTDRGVMVSLQRDERGNIIRITRPDRTDLSIRRNGNGSIHYVRTGDGARFEYEYDDDGRPLRITRDDGAITTYRYEPDTSIAAVERSTRREYEDGTVESWRYTPAGRVLEHTTRSGAHYSYEYDRWGEPSVIRETTNGLTWRYHRDEFGRLSSVDLPEGGSISWRYGPDGEVSTATYPDGQFITRTEEPGGTLRFAYRGGGLTLTRDPWDRIRSVRRDEGPLREYRYRPGMLEIREDGVITMTELYDRYGRTRERRYPDGTGEEFRYNPWDDLLAFTDRTGGTWRYEYDETGRPVERRDPAGRTTTWWYGPDLLGRRDWDGFEEVARFDATRRLRSVTSPLGEVTIDRPEPRRMVVAEPLDPAGTTVRYDELLRLRSWNGRRGSGTAEWPSPRRAILRDGTVVEDIAFDWTGEIAEIVYGDSETWRIERDGAGALTAVVRPDGVRTEVPAQPGGPPPGGPPPAVEVGPYGAILQERIDLGDGTQTTRRYIYDDARVLVGVEDDDGEVGWRCSECGVAGASVDAAGGAAGGARRVVQRFEVGPYELETTSVNGVLDAIRVRHGDRSTVFTLRRERGEERIVVDETLVIRDVRIGRDRARVFQERYRSGFTTVHDAVLVLGGEDGRITAEATVSGSIHRYLYDRAGRLSELDRGYGSGDALDGAGFRGLPAVVERALTAVDDTVRPHSGSLALPSSLQIIGLDRDGIGRVQSVGFRADEPDLRFDEQGRIVEYRERNRRTTTFRYGDDGLPGIVTLERGDEQRLYRLYRGNSGNVVSVQFENGPDTVSRYRSVEHEERIGRVTVGFRLWKRTSTRHPNGEGGAIDKYEEGPDDTVSLSDDTGDSLLALSLGGVPVALIEPERTRVLFTDYRGTVRGVAIRAGASESYRYRAMPVGEIESGFIGRPTTPDVDPAEELLSSPASPFLSAFGSLDGIPGSPVLLGQRRAFLPALGMFTSPDPAGDGLDWMQYCQGDPVNFVDRSGLFTVAISTDYYQQSDIYGGFGLGTSRSHTIGASGCVLTAATRIIDTVNAGHDINVPGVNAYAIDNGYYSNGDLLSSENIRRLVQDVSGRTVQLTSINPEEVDMAEIVRVIQSDTDHQHLVTARIQTFSLSDPGYRYGHTVNVSGFRPDGRPVVADTSVRGRTILFSRERVIRYDVYTTSQCPAY